MNILQNFLGSGDKFTGTDELQAGSSRRNSTGKINPGEDSADFLEVLSSKLSPELELRPAAKNSDFSPENNSRDKSSPSRDFLEANENRSGGSLAGERESTGKFESALSQSGAGDRSREKLSTESRKTLKKLRRGDLDLSDSEDFRRVKKALEELAEKSDGSEGQAVEEKIDLLQDLFKLAERDLEDTNKLDELVSEVKKMVDDLEQFVSKLNGEIEAKLEANFREQLKKLGFDSSEIESLLAEKKAGAGENLVDKFQKLKDKLKKLDELLNSRSKSEGEFGEKLAGLLEGVQKQLEELSSELNRDSGSGNIIENMLESKLAKFEELTEGVETRDELERKISRLNKKGEKGAEPGKNGKEKAGDQNGEETSEKQKAAEVKSAAEESGDGDPGGSGEGKGEKKTADKARDESSSKSSQSKNSEGKKESDFELSPDEGKKRDSEQLQAEASRDSSEKKSAKQSAGQKSEERPRTEAEAEGNSDTNQNRGTRVQGKGSTGSGGIDPSDLSPEQLRRLQNLQAQSGSQVESMDGSSISEELVQELASGSAQSKEVGSAGDTDGSTTESAVDVNIGKQTGKNETGKNRSFDTSKTGRMKEYEANSAHAKNSSDGRGHSSHGNNGGGGQKGSSNFGGGSSASTTYVNSARNRERIIQAQEMIDKLAEKTKTLVDENEQSMRLQLQPEQLGEVQVEVSVEADRVSARFRVEENKVKEDLEGKLRELKQSLDRTGLEIDDVEIDDLDVEADEDFEQWFDEEEAAAAPENSGSGAEAGEELEADSSNRSVRSYSTIELVA